MDRSGAEVAAELIRATRQDVLRRAAMRHKGWAKVLRGFRPQALTKELALTRAEGFASEPLVLRELAEAFLESAGVPKEGRLEERLTTAAGNEDLPEAVREVCRQLAGEDGEPSHDHEAVVPSEPDDADVTQKPTRASRRRAAKA